MGGFSARKASEISGVALAQVLYWSRASVCVPTGTDGAYSMGDCLALGVIGVLRQRRVPLSCCCKVQTVLRSRGSESAYLWKLTLFVSDESPPRVEMVSTLRGTLRALATPDRITGATLVPLAPLLRAIKQRAKGLDLAA